VKTILCIDDQQDSLEIRRLFLETLGYRAITALSGEKGLRLLNDGATVDLVILDYKMEGMDGLEVARHLRRHHSELPIILLTGYTTELPREIKSLADCIIAKGLPAKELLRAISQIVGDGEKSAAPIPPDRANQLLDVSLRHADRANGFVRRASEESRRVYERLNSQINERQRRRPTRKKRKNDQISEGRPGRSAT